MRQTSTPQRRALPLTPVGDTDPFRPSVDRPVRVRARHMAVDTHFEPHHHAWGQLAYCASGVLRVTAAQYAGVDDATTYIVPPSRAVWIAPGARHAVDALEDAAFRTLYIDASAAPPGWMGCRVIVVSPLLRELVRALDELGQAPSQPAVEVEVAASPDDEIRPARSSREQLLAHLVLDEMAGAATQPLGVPLPHPQTGDKRLRALCEAVLRAPAERATLADWARDIGASERTVARLFRDELGTSYQQWRQQVVLAHALPLLARGLPVGQVASASGYASDSAFTAMFKAAMGQPPSAFHADSLSRR